MSDETALRDLFDRWERVWHEGQYDLVSDCIAPNYIRHDEPAANQISLALRIIAEVRSLGRMAPVVTTPQLIERAFQPSPPSRITGNTWV
jgi:hypothetical protein